MSLQGISTAVWHLHVTLAILALTKVTTVLLKSKSKLGFLSSHHSR